MYPLEINFEIPIACVFSDQNICSGQVIPSILVLSGTTRTNDNPSIGLSAAGSRNIPSFTAINNKVAPVLANIVVTTIIFCVNRTTNYRITINPISSVNDTLDQTISVNTATTEITLICNNGSTIYNWTNDNTATGLAEI